MNSRPIGVFDSGVGGLTVLKALREALPCEHFIYLGDTARLPYGTKGAATVAQYVTQAAHLLLRYDIKLLVVACNTATALALPSLQDLLPQTPSLGVIEPSAKKAAELSLSGRIAVLSTEGTARSGAYAAAIRRYRPAADVRLLGCNLLVGMVEEGWCTGPEVEAVLARYLGQLATDYDTLVLGCTHFPMLAAPLRKLIPSPVSIVDTANATAEAVRTYLIAHQFENNLHKSDNQPALTFLATDLPERFAAVAQRFLDLPQKPEVALVDLVPMDISAMKDFA